MAIPHAAPNQIVSVEPLGPDLAATKTWTVIKTERMQVIRLVVLAGKALIKTARSVHSEGLSPRIEIFGVDLVGMFHPADPGLTCLRLVEASLTSWRPERLFDLITCVHGLHYVGDKLGLIARAASWLTGDGIFEANLDLENVKFSDGRAAGRRVTADLRRAGVEYDRRKRLVVCRGGKAVDLPHRYLGADDRAGPNFTGQSAVDSYYEVLPRPSRGGKAIPSSHSKNPPKP